MLGAKRRAAEVLFLVATILGGCRSSTDSSGAPPPVATTVVAEPAEPPPPPEVREVRVARIERNKTFGGTVTAMGLAAAEVEPLVSALKEVFDFRKMRLGDQLRLTLKDGRLDLFEYRASVTDEWIVRREGERLVAARQTVTIERQRAVVDLRVSTSLYEAMVEAGEDPALAVSLADVFAWDIDFYRDVRHGDRLRAVVEKEFVGGRLLRYGEILGARYEGGQVGSKRYLRYTTLAGDTSYFDSTGTSAKKTFLKSPLKFVHITSRYGGRVHPVKGYYHAHNGVDFAAPIGTPVWSVADGTVTRAVRGDRAAGNYLFIRHANGMETGYLHLSRFGEGIRTGTRVRQKQVVAFTGNTGTSTGPHLHYAMKRGGQYINPQTVRFPRAEPLPRAELERFRELTLDVAAQLDAERVVQREHVEAARL